MKTALLLVVVAFGVAIHTLSVRAEDYTYMSLNGKIIITGYTGTGGDVNIPGTINGLPVIRIDPQAFSGRSSLTSVTIPNTVTSIEFLAFDSCSNLTNVTIGSSVTWIGERAFNVCTKLASVTIPKSVTHIGDAAFRECSSLTSVTIPNGVTNIEGVFSFCGGLTNVTIPNSVTSIGIWTFVNCTSLTSVTIPDSVTHIGGSAFAGCTGLTSVTIPDSVTSIGDYAFGGCDSLTGLYFEGSPPDAVFLGAPKATAYYLPGPGWGPTFADLPTAPWVLPNPMILSRSPSFGIQSNVLGFRITWATNVPIVVEASTAFASPIWTPLSTNTLTDGWSYFSDPDWTNYPVRFYRVRLQ